MLNFIIFLIKYLITNFKYYIKTLPSFFLNVEAYLSDDHKSDCFIIKNSYANRNEQDYKFMIGSVLHLLGEVYSKYSNQQFTFILIFSEVTHNRDLHNIIAQPCLFRYNVNNPLTVDELYNLIQFNKSAFINNSKDIVITIKSTNTA